MEFVDSWGLGAFAEVVDVVRGKKQAADVVIGKKQDASSAKSGQWAWALQAGVCERQRPAPPWHAVSSKSSINFASSSQTTLQAHQSGTGDLSFHFYRKVCYVAGGILAVLAVLFELFHWRIANVDFNKPLPRLPQDDKVRVDLSKLFAGLCQLSYPFWFGSSSASRTGRCLLAVLLLMTVLSVALNYAVNAYSNDFMLALTTHDGPWLTQLGIFNLILIIAGTLNVIYTGYIGSFIQILWREQMTEELSALWTAEHANYYMQFEGHDLKLSTPEQRIQEDVEIFTGQCLMMFLQLFSSVLSFAMFLPVLFALSPTKFVGMFPLPGWLLYLIIVWCFTGFTIKHHLGREKVVLTWLKQDTEAKLRHSLSSMRTNAEAIRVMGAQNQVTAQTEACFDNVKVVVWKSMKLNQWMAWFDSLYENFQSTAFQLILLPGYIAGDLAMNEFFQLHGVILSLTSSLNLVVDNYDTVTLLRATTDRLLALRDSAVKAREYNKQLPEIVHPPQGADDNFALRATFGSITSPCGATLWSDLSLDVLPGKRVLITGPDGSGKSSLLLALHGIWPFVSKSQIEVNLAYSDKLFVPSQSILPEWCTLAEAVTYPDPRGKWSDEELHRVLQDVGLKSRLQDTESGNTLTAATPQASLRQTSPHQTDAEDPELDTALLDKIENWSQVLSNGMLQRLSIAHVILRRPRMLLLDEATSSLPPSAATALYSLMLASLPEDAIVISVSHQVDCMRPLHNVHWEVKLEDLGATVTKQLLKTTNP